MPALYKSTIQDSHTSSATSTLVSSSSYSSECNVVRRPSRITYMCPQDGIELLKCPQTTRLIPLELSSAFNQAPVPFQPKKTKMKKDEAKVVSFAESSVSKDPDPRNEDRMSMKVVKKSSKWACTYDLRKRKHKSNQKTKPSVNFEEDTESSKGKNKSGLLWNKKKSSTVYKTYSIGKNTKLNITVSNPLNNLLTRENKFKKAKGFTKKIKKESVNNDTGTGYYHERELLKDVIKRNKQHHKMNLKSSSDFSIPRTLPELEEGSEESFRTFVLETSMYQNNSSSKSKLPLPDQNFTPKCQRTNIDYPTVSSLASSKSKIYNDSTDPVCILGKTKKSSEDNWFVNEDSTIRSATSSVSSLSSQRNLKLRTNSSDKYRIQNPNRKNSSAFSCLKTSNNNESMSVKNDIYSTRAPTFLRYGSLSFESSIAAVSPKISEIPEETRNYDRSKYYFSDKNKFYLNHNELDVKIPGNTSAMPSRGILKKPKLDFLSLPTDNLKAHLESQNSCSSTSENDSGLDCESHEGDISKLSPLPNNILDQKFQISNTVLRGWKQKYDFLLGVVKEPSRLLVDSLTEEVRVLRTKRQHLIIERGLLQSKLDSRDIMGGAKGVRRSRERPENIRSLYEQVANLDCMLTSLETQIEVLSSVQDSLPKEFHDTFHDSGTSGHEPDSLEAIETLVGDQGMLDKRNNTEGGVDEGPGNGPGPGGGKPGEAAVLLHLERCAHKQTRRSLQQMELKFKSLQQELGVKNNKLSEGSVESLRDINLNSFESLNSIASSDRFVEELKASGLSNCDYPQIKILFPSPYLSQLREMTISQLRVRVLQLEKARLDKVPMDAAKEITRLNATLIQLEKARDEITLQNFTLKSRLAEVTSKINDPAATYQISKELSLRSTDTDDSNSMQKNLRKSTYKVNSDSQKLRQIYSEFGATEQELKKKIIELEEKLKNQQNEATQNFDRHIRNLETQFEDTQKKLEVTQNFLLGKEEECNMIKLDFETLNEENRRLKEQLNDSISKYQEITNLNQQCEDLENELCKLEDENRLLVEDFNRERVLRKKYYNQIEDMKGKIRVFCRVRPFTESEKRTAEVTRVEDEFSLNLETSRGPKSFQFDRVFTHEEDQSQVFEDTHALIQSALDGYNVTIMAYGQTGSGKTYTMLGSDSNPGIAPRAFQRIFKLAEEGRARHDVSVSAYMLELYNDKLIDLLKTNGYNEPSEKLDIKRDKKGSVYVSGASVRNVASSAELNTAFEEGLSNRHTASTKMNLNSSRSHLLITVLLTVTSKQTGSVFQGKLTLVDLAGSERVHKSGVSADQLKEANSINKSLSALGDVISALSSECSFVPYRNSKLTMLLQDSIGGNAKTLVFVNVSPAGFNCEETLVSLMYASRIKQVTNTACKNSDTKEICRLKTIISKLKKGEDPDEEFL